MKSTSSYKFIHKFEDAFEVTLKTSAQTTTDIVQEFADFLKGCQFAEQSIREALVQVAYEMGYED